jgi:NADP-dependent 3-hydroxy acid dehydrogenase YdfG
MSRIIFITGATSGIGKACAEVFAKNGDHLIINGRRANRLEDLKKDLTSKYSTKILCAPFDVKDKNASIEFVNSLSEKWKQIDVLINSAGLALGRGLFNEGDLSDWETMIDTNVTGLLFVSKAVLPLMIEQKKGHIINLGSVAGDDMYERGNVYCASKAAVDAISRSMRIDLLPHHIKVTNIKPGAVESEFALVRFKGDAEQASKTYVGYTPLSPEDIAGAIFYAASLPPNVCINELTITCTSQANGVYFNKK